MNVYVCTDKPSIREHFASLERARSVSCTFLKSDELESFFDDSSGEGLLYIDIASVKEAVWRQRLKAAEKGDSRIIIGIVDPSGAVSDVAGLFHRGAADYIGKKTLPGGVITKRIRDVFAFKTAEDAGRAEGDEKGRNKAKENGQQKADWCLAPKGWEEIKNGSTYTFTILYVQLDMMEEWKKKSGQVHIDAVQKIFHDHVENVFSPAGGRIWMWMKNAGLLLFPFNGKNCIPLVPSIRTQLNRDITSIELFKYNTQITYTMVLHIGNTVYKSRGDTGDIVSDTINFIFHMAKHYTKPGNLYCTETISPFIPDGLTELFVQNGTFESTGIYRMKQPKD